MNFMYFKVMSFNLRNSGANDGVNGWVHRKDAVLRLINDYDPDMLGIQEGLPDQVQYLDSALADRLRIGRNRDVEGGEYAAIYLKRDSVEVLDSGNFWLSETPDVPGSKHWGNNCVRMATWVLCKVRGSEPLLMVNTHLDHESELARQKGVQLINRFIGAKGHPAILTGDMNCEPSSVSIQFLTGRVEIDGEKGSLIDSRDEMGIADFPGTFNGFSDKTFGTIDYILHSAHMKAGSYKVITDRPLDKRPSDHFPIMAELAMA